MKPGRTGTIDYWLPEGRVGGGRREIDGVKGERYMVKERILTMGGEILK